jgi:multicomponent K+:H+ antiporter subunit G
MTAAVLPLWVTLPGTLLLIAAGLLTLIAAIGLLRLPDFYSRIHPPTMGTTLGTGCVLIASMLVSSSLMQRPVLHELLITLFIVITTPITAMLLMRAAVYRTEHAARGNTDIPGRLGSGKQDTGE